ncbi:hypothetical protein ['Camptotheca acuminata' phytoplasma]|uniref:hypothetical protein n=1 Tax='Camptotheca acuminata' phytoplasma TaxID=3239192 RepID=UPI00351AAAA1
MLLICPLMLLFAFLFLKLESNFIIKWCTLGLSIVFLVLFIYCHVSYFILIIKQKKLFEAVDKHKNLQQ